LDEHEQKLHYDWKDLELTGPKFQLRDLWERKNLGTATSVSVTLPPHACALYRLSQ